MVISNQYLKKKSFVFLQVREKLIFKCVCVCLSAPNEGSARKGRVIDSPEVRLQQAVSFPRCGCWEPSPGSPGRAAIALNC